MDHWFPLIQQNLGYQANLVLLLDRRVQLLQILAHPSDRAALADLGFLGVHQHLGIQGLPFENIQVYFI